MDDNATSPTGGNAFVSLFKKKKKSPREKPGSCASCCHFHAIHISNTRMRTRRHRLEVCFLWKRSCRNRWAPKIASRLCVRSAVCRIAKWMQRVDFCFFVFFFIVLWSDSLTLSHRGTHAHTPLYPFHSGACWDLPDGFLFFFFTQPPNWNLEMCSLSCAPPTSADSQWTVSLSLQRIKLKF